MRRRGWQVSRSGRLREETFDGPLGLLPRPGRGEQQQRADGESAARATGATDHPAPSAHSSPSGRDAEDPGAAIERDLLHERERDGPATGAYQVGERRHRLGAPRRCKSDPGHVASLVPSADLAHAGSDPDPPENGQHGVRLVLLELCQLHVHVRGESCGLRSATSYLPRSTSSLHQRQQPQGRRDVACERLHQRSGVRSPRVQQPASSETARPSDEEERRTGGGGETVEAVVNREDEGFEAKDVCPRISVCVGRCLNTESNRSRVRIDDITSLE